MSQRRPRGADFADFADSPELRLSCANPARRAAAQGTSVTMPRVPILGGFSGARYSTISTPAVTAQSLRSTVYTLVHHSLVTLS